MVGIGGLDGFGGDAEVAFREAREECVTIGDEGRALGVGFVGLALGFLVLPVNGLALVRLLDRSGFRDFIPRSEGGVPHLIELLHVAVAFAHEVDGGFLSRDVRGQRHKHR